MKFKGTTVCFRKRSDGAILGYEVSGHTHYAEAGADIVCAAISALSQTTLLGLQQVLLVPVMYDREEDAAFLEVQFTPEIAEDRLQQAQLLLRTLLLGLQALEREYPHNLRVILKERR